MKVLVCLLVVFTVCSLGCALASEHPPHGVAPGEALAEHSGKHTVSREAVIKGIKDHIDSVISANAGIFAITDPADGKDLRLKLITVHEDKVSYIKKDDAYFACADFAGADGTATYDLDFWMQEKEGGLKVVQTKIHKKDGAPRFTYKDDEIVDIGSSTAPEGEPRSF